MENGNIPMIEKASPEVKVPAIAALIKFRPDGRISEVLIIADSDKDTAIAEYGLARIVRPACWGWLRYLCSLRERSRPPRETNGYAGTQYENFKVLPLGISSK